MLESKNVLVAVTGGIACYKACGLVSALKKAGACVNVVMTAHAAEFVAPLTFETLSANPVACDMFAPKEHWEVEHVSLAKKADLVIIAPATANVLDKLAAGIADDMLTTTLLATKAKVLACPAMNTAMYENEAVQSAIKTLKARGYEFLEPESGLLACGDVGKGRMCEPEEIYAKALDMLMPKRDYAGKTVLVTAGATREDIDGVRFISNYSSGKMGIEIAKAVKNRGGRVILVAGFVTAKIPAYIDETVSVKSTCDMYDAVMSKVGECDFVIKAAAPADYRVEKVADDKIKDSEVTLELTKNPDIAKAVGKVKGDKKLVVFCAEKRELIERAEGKLKSKNADMVVANDVTKEGAGFDVDTNIATLITKDGKVRDCELMTKAALADVILDELIAL
ncbi:MAG TPA: bifunctional phosphopantothenoylcysteine decarboxylase/phosphopantothenate--cysteine ligase CoaBC [Candidatus Ornithoclostridium faecavium]|nr:bifunctional phosphopantothenoylcysteine decarboxylase/phosphopantothenate--cysteine ligase CoaBC [Candidatus Ornithoclostridium faecavium]